jgi:hypothetical protein
MARPILAIAAGCAGALCAVRVAEAHGLMLDPISRNARHGLATQGGNMWFSHGCTVGCSACSKCLSASATQPL